MISDLYWATSAEYVHNSAYWSCNSQQPLRCGYRYSRVTDEETIVKRFLKSPNVTQLLSGRAGIEIIWFGSKSRTLSICTHYAIFSITISLSNSYSQIFGEATEVQRGEETAQGLTTGKELGVELWLQAITKTITLEGCKVVNTGRPWSLGCVHVYNCWTLRCRRASVPVSYLHYD